MKASKRPTRARVGAEVTAEAEKKVGSNQVRGRCGTERLRFGKARRHDQWVESGRNGHRRAVWRRVAAERKVRHVEADDD